MELKRAGTANFVGLCPFHAEKTPSFNVHEARQFFHCFGCGEKGDVFTFVTKIEQRPFAEVLRDLARDAGVDLPEKAMSPAERQALVEAESEKGLMLRAVEAAVAFFEQQLQTPAGAAARAYISGRGISDDVARRFRLGYAPAAWDALQKHLASLKIPPAIAERLGLVGVNERGRYDFFRDRVMLPVLDRQKRPMGFSSRLLDPEAKDRKYVNSPDSPLFHKKEQLYGMHAALDAIRKQRRAVVVEGNFDVLSLHEAGITEAVAPMGTALTAEQVAMLGRTAERVVMVFDGDSAGERAGQKAVPLFVDADVDGRIARLPAGQDPDDFVRREGAEAFRKLIEAGRPVVEQFIDDLARATEATIPDRMKALEDAAVVLGRVHNPTARELYVGRLASTLGLSSSQVWRAVRSAAAEQSSRRPHGRSPDRSGAGTGDKARAAPGRTGGGRADHRQARTEGRPGNPECRPARGRVADRSGPPAGLPARAGRPRPRAEAGRRGLAGKDARGHSRRDRSGVDGWALRPRAGCAACLADLVKRLETGRRERMLEQYKLAMEEAIRQGDELARRELSTRTDGTDPNETWGASPRRGRENKMIEDAEESLSMEIEDDDDDAAEAAPPANKRSASSKETEKKKRELISIGKAKGFLTYDEINDHMPENIVSSDQIDDWLSTLGGEGIEVVDSANQVKVTDKGVDGQPEAEEEEAETATAEKEEAEQEEEEDGFSKTNDPVRMYLRKMGSVSLLTREGEVEIAKRIEDGERRVLQVVLNCNVAIEEILELGDKLRKQKLRVKDVVKDVDEEDAEFDEQWHIERVCKVIDKVRRLHKEAEKVDEKATAKAASRGFEEAGQDRARRPEEPDVRGAAGAAPQQEADRSHRRQAEVLRHPHRGGEPRGRTTARAARA